MIALNKFIQNAISYHGLAVSLNCMSIYYGQQSELCNGKMEKLL